MTQDQITRHIQTYKASELSEATGLDKSTISRHRNGGKMSAVTIAMYRFFFELEELKADKKTLIEALSIKSADNS